MKYLRITTPEGEILNIGCEGIRIQGGQVRVTVLQEDTEEMAQAVEALGGEFAGVVKGGMLEVVLPEVDDYTTITMA